MPSPLPLLALRAFAEVGRRGSIKAAAEALGVTPGAVSQQVKALEARLGAALLARGNRTIQLTEAGFRLHHRLDDAFRAIEEAVTELRPARTRRTLTVTTVPSFAASWLVPRLGRFAERHPEIELRLETTVRVVDLLREPVDVALRHGLGDWPGLSVERLLAPHLVPVASPALLAAGPRIRGPADCLRYTLLQDSDSADWVLWLKAHGVEDRRAGRGPSFGDGYLLVRAAVAGQGLALVPDLYAAEELAAGRLVPVLDLPWPTRFAYYIVTRPELAASPKIAAFRRWLLDEAGISSAGVEPSANRPQ